MSIQNAYIDFEVNIQYCSNCTIKNNDFSFHDSTLEIVNSNTISISNNDFTDCLKAIKFLNSLDCLVYDNHFNYCHEGIFVHSSNEIEISSNNITQSRYVDSIGVGSGIYLDNSKNAIIHNNLIQSCGESAVNVTNSPDLSIIDNTIINNYIGIYLEDQEKGISFSYYGSYIFNNNLFKNKLYGIHTKYSNYLHFSANMICNNSYLGILIEESKFSLIENNICSDNGNNGVLIKNSNKIHIRNNLIKLNEYNGILMMNTSYSIITFNSFEENKKYGLSLDYKCSENIIHHNHFFYNNLAGTSQASDDGSSNIWYLEEIEQGNYWNDFEQENDYYQIDGNAKSRDLYPLSNDENEDNTNAINFHLVSLVSLIFTLGCFYFRRKKRNKLSKEMRGIKR
jgi:parallel beta-helix repeat protein